MKYELKGFQTDAAKGILARLRHAQAGFDTGAGLQAVGLEATTGAGKTVIAAAVIEAILGGSEELGIQADPDAVFLWMTDLPQLNTQTMRKIGLATSGLRADTLVEIPETFNEPRLSSGHAYFLNTQKLTKNALLTRRGPQVKRAFNFYDVIKSTLEDHPRRKLYLVVDEAHRGMVEAKSIDEANSIIQRFIKGYAGDDGAMPPVPVVLGISATPGRFNKLVENSGRTVSAVSVPVDEVRESGLIKDKTFAVHAGERQRDAMALLEKAVQTWKAMTDEWRQYHDKNRADDEELVVPALIIQVENEPGGGKRTTKTPLDAVLRVIAEHGEALPQSAFVHAFGSKQPEQAGGRTIRYLEPSAIEGDSDARVVFFKSALGTGWDCPRAEVMFSFRSAADATSIAQTIGRMVRSPLARRIEENEALNAAHVFLPFYNEHGVKTIIERLNESGNEAVAGSMSTGDATIALQLRTDMAEAVDAIKSLPSYRVGTPRSRPEIRVLVDLANFLSSNGLDEAAYSGEVEGLVDVLVQRRQVLAKSTAFADEIKDQGEITIHSRDLFNSTTDEPLVGHLTASEAAIDRLYAAAKVRLIGDVAKAYVLRRMADEPGLGTRVARLEAYALASRPEVMTTLNQHAAGRIEVLNETHRRGARKLSPAKHERFSQIMRHAPTPTVKSIDVLPEKALFTRGDAAPELHLFLDDGGEAPIKLNTWEAKAIAEDLERPDVIAWLRCVERAEWALCVPWKDGHIEKPFYPDFLIVRRDTDGEPVVDISDPHDHQRGDALGKAQGLAKFAADHGDDFGHIDLIAEIGGQLRRIHLEKPRVRAEVLGITTHAQLKKLYEQAD